MSGVSVSPAAAGAAPKCDSDDILPAQAEEFARRQADAKAQRERDRLKKGCCSRALSRLAACLDRCRCCCCRKTGYGELPGSLAGWDDMQFGRLTRWLDGVGEPEVKHDEYDPTKYPKSVWGALTTTALRVMVLLLVVWYLYQLFTFKTLINQGAVMQFNPPLPGQSGQQIDVPTLEFHLSSALTFYEAHSPSLQRVDVQDMTGYNPTLVSRASKVPLSTAFYASTTVDLNSFDSSAQAVDAAAAPVQLNMRDRSYALSTHAFSESIKVLYEDALVYPTDDGFFNHTAVVYARIPQPALRAIKPCQAQLLLYNKAVYNGLARSYVLDDSKYQSPELFPGLASSDELWAPSSFGPSGKHNSISLKDSNRTLLKLSSRMTTDVMQRFASNQSWGAQQANLSALYNVSNTGTGSSGAYMTQLDFLNWELSFSYVNNMRHTFTNVSCDGDESSFDLLYAQSSSTISASATTLTIDSFRLGNDSWQAFDPEWLPYNILVIGAMGQEEMTVTAVDDGPVLTVSRPNPIDFVWTGPAFTCDSDLFPTSVAALSTPWTCDTAKYWANDACDCGCGAYDPDCCLMIGPTVANCVNSQTCSPVGTCVNAFVSDPRVLLISETCYEINHPGEVAVAGYVGSPEQFAAAGGDQCFPCPGDRTLYGGAAQLDADTSTYTCNVAATAALSGADNFQNPPAAAGTADWLVHAHSAPFPTMGFPYPIQIGDGPLTEVLYVYNATAASASGEQALSVGTASRAAAFKYGSHVALGKLVSAMASDSDLLVVVRHPLDTQGHPFSVRGPYNVRAAEQAVVVTAASVLGNKPYQVLRMQTVPSEPLGYSSYLQQAAYAGDAVIKVAPFRFWWDSQVGVAETDWSPHQYPTTVPILLRGSQDFNGLEVIHSASTTSPPTWLCDPSYFHAGDGCDCNCGLWDPDCGVAGMTVYDSSVNCTRNASCASAHTCPYCAWSNTAASYPTGTCATTDPSNPSPIPATLDSQTFYQLITLSQPLVLSHVAGVAAETPVPLSSVSDADWYNDSSSVYNVFTYATVELSRTAAQFTPDDRFDSHPPELSTSPSTIPVEFAMYIIPDRPSFDHTPLCAQTAIPNTVAPTFTRYGWDRWHVAADRQLNVSGCTGRPAPAELVDGCVPVSSQEALQDFNLHCIQEMAPSYLFDFDVKMPINNKWQYAKNNSVSGTNQPEYEFDFQVVYHFSRDSSFLKAEREFAQNQPNGGDLLRSDGSVYTFYGQRDEATTDTGGQNSTTELPATTPYANVQLVLQPSMFAMADLKALKPANWPTDASALQQLLDSFPSLTLRWDLDVVDGSTLLQQVPLVPGYAYFLSADISITAKYKTDIIGRVSVDSWTIEATSGTPSAVPLDYFQRQQAVLRYKLNLKDDSHQLVEVYATNLSLFVGNVGGALNYLVHAAVIAGVIHRLLQWNTRQDLYKKAAERRGSSGSGSARPLGPNYADTAARQTPGSATKPGGGGPKSGQPQGAREKGPVEVRPIRQH